MQVTHKPRAARSGAALRGDLLRRLNVKQDGKTDGNPPNSVPTKPDLPKVVRVHAPTGAQASPEHDKAKRWRSRDGLALDPEQLASLLLPSAPFGKSGRTRSGSASSGSRMRERAASMGSDIGDFAIEAAAFVAEQDAENSRSLHRDESPTDTVPVTKAYNTGVTTPPTSTVPSGFAVDARLRSRKDSDSEGEEAEEEVNKLRLAATPRQNSSAAAQISSPSPLLVASKAHKPLSPLGRIPSPGTSMYSPSKMRSPSDSTAFSLGIPALTSHAAAHDGASGTSTTGFSDSFAALETPSDLLAALELRLGPQEGGVQGAPCPDIRFYIILRAQKISLRNSLKLAKAKGKLVEHSAPVAELIRRHAGTTGRGLVFLASPAHTTSMCMNPDEYPLLHAGVALPETAPTEPVARGDPRWTVSATCPQCQHCNARFTLMQRKHHCRGCGAVVCAECTPYKTKDMQKLCRACNSLRRGSVLRRSKFDTQCFIDAIVAGEVGEVEKRLQWGQPVNVVNGVEGITPLHAVVSAYGHCAHRAARECSGPAPRSATLSAAMQNEVPSITSVLLNKPSSARAIAEVSFHPPTPTEKVQDTSVGRAGASAAEEHALLAASSGAAANIYGLLASMSLPSALAEISQEDEDRAVTIAKLLLRNGASVNIATHSGLTPLHSACAFGTPAVVKLLLDSGALQARTDGNKLTAYDYAELRCNAYRGSDCMYLRHGEQIQKMLDSKYATGMVDNHRQLLTTPFTRRPLVEVEVPAITALRSSIAQVPDDEMNRLLDSPLAKLLSGTDPAVLGVPEGGEGEGPSDNEAAAQSRAEALPMPPKTQLLEMGVQCLDPAAQALQANLLAVRNGNERWLNEHAWMWDFGGQQSSRSKYVELGMLPVNSWHELAWRRECQLVGKVWKLGHPADADGDVAPAVETAYLARNPTSTFNTVMEIRKEAIDLSTLPPVDPVVIAEDDGFERYSAEGFETSSDSDSSSEELSTASKVSAHHVSSDSGSVESDLGSNCARTISVSQ